MRSATRSSTSHGRRHTVGLLAASLAVCWTALATSGAPVSATEFEPLAEPVRLADTRNAGQTTDGKFQGGGPVAAGSTLMVQIAGRGNVAPDADAVTLNVTAVGASEAGFFTVHPCGERPNASSLNYRAGQNVANTVFAMLDSSGQTCVYTSASSNVIIDAAGTLPTGSFDGIAPSRIVDTRPTGRTVDGDFQNTGRFEPGETREIRVAGRADVSADADSVVLNVTAVGPASNGFFTIFPCGPLPNASNLNFVQGHNIANAATTGVSATGTICVHSSASAHAIVDVAGVLTTSAFNPLPAPERFADSRPTGTTIDGRFTKAGARPAGGTMQLAIAGRGQIPDNASAVILNVTAVQPADRGFLTLYPRSIDRPNTSSLNFSAGENIANLTVARLGSNGDVCLFTSAATHVIVDVTGYLTGPAPSSSGAGCPVPVAFQPGQYFVGSDIPAGRYTMENATAGCYWERQSGLSGELEDVINNGFRSGDGREIVDISADDLAFEFDEDCGEATLYQPVNTRLTTITRGGHVVGDHIVAGTYRADASEDCYWERLASFNGSFVDLIDNNFTRDPGEVFVTIEATDVGFYSHDNCGVWQLV